MKIRAYAKINLSLDVLGLMENGYHRLDMVMHMVDLHDVVEILWTPGEEGGLKVHLDAGDPGLPVDEGNLAMRAVSLLRKEDGRAAAINGSLHISIEKNIPIAAGLAGGSGNGAAVLLGLNHLWQLGHSLSEMCALGSRLGADVPFSVMGIAALNEELGFSDDPLAATCARATGSGTELEPLPAFRSGVVLSKPPISVSTAEAYRGVDECTITERPDVAAQVAAIRKKDVKQVYSNMVNVLENYTLKRYYIVMYTKNKMREVADSAAVLMSGSGPTVFALTDDPEEKKRIFEALKSVNKETYSTETAG
ncbi:MAG: 4-(cytidine 5'-diphospho)-2-C-methyl-D-erythritol kinase [Anaerovoracaceae bacterium]|jgi:4-diphosphocytidyl-2-C-methyl-D-erythritol kinase